MSFLSFSPLIGGTPAGRAPTPDMLYHWIVCCFSVFVIIVLGVFSASAIVDGRVPV